MASASTSSGRSSISTRRLHSRLVAASRNAEWFVARGLGPHWSIGLDGAIASSTFDNTRFFSQIAPAVEYSIFPYREYRRGRFVLRSEIREEHARYNEITVFNRLRETHGRHALSANLDTRQPWGSLEVGIEWSRCPCTTSASYRVELDGEVSLRVVRGLEIEVEKLPRASATSCRSRGAARLRRKCCCSSGNSRAASELRFSVGVSYTFGSLFNNVVNPRFGNRQNGNDQ